MRYLVRHGNVRKLHPVYPDFIGFLFSPGGWVTAGSIPFAIDNGRYTVWTSGKEWDPSTFLHLLQRCVDVPQIPLWVVVPDVVADAGATFEWWKKWSKRVSAIHPFALALAVQDGMSIKEVKQVRPKPDVIFVGGSTNWKWRTVDLWAGEFPRVHVGRVNTERGLWKCQKLGVESCDGTGFFRGDKQREAGLHRFMERLSKGLGPKITGFLF